MVRDARTAKQGDMAMKTSWEHVSYVQRADTPYTPEELPSTNAVLVVRESIQQQELLAKTVHLGSMEIKAS
jgi:hypothetical protein